MMSMRTTPLLALPFLLLSLNGCASAPMGIAWDPDDSTPAGEVTRLPLPVRLAVRPASSKYFGFHQVVLTALRTSSNFSQVEVTGHPSLEKEFDFVVDLEYLLETNARWYNGLIMFPGFAILAPHWVSLRWDFDVTTKLKLLRARDGTELGRAVRRDGHEIAYTSPGYGVAADMGFLGILFLPAFGSPLFGGLVTMFTDSQPLKYRYRFYQSPAGREWGSRVANLIATRIETSLNAGRGPKTTRALDPPGEPRSKKQ